MVGSYLQLIERKYGDALDAAAHEYLRFAVDGAQRMDTLIRDLLEYARVDSHGEAFQDVDAGEVLDTALANLRRAIDDSGGTVETGPLPRVEADPSQLMQVFQNLVANGLKYCPEDRTPRIRVTARIENGRAVFSVADNGIGIAAGDYERIFTIFQRLHGRGEYSGTGVGLAVCKRIVDRHGGRIWVDSTVGEGSTFYFTLTPAISR